MSFFSRFTKICLIKTIIFIYNEESVQLHNVKGCKKRTWSKHEISQENLASIIYDILFLHRPNKTRPNKDFSQNFFHKIKKHVKVKPTSNKCFFPVRRCGFFFSKWAYLYSNNFFSCLRSYSLKKLQNCILCVINHESGYYFVQSGLI